MTSKTKKILVIGAVLAAMALAVAALVPLTTARAASGWGDEGGNGEPPLGNYEEALAYALGISVEDLQAAYQTAREAAVQQALDDGTITQEQADRMLEAEQDGHFGRDGRFGFGPQGDEFLADALGISVEDLQAAQEQAHAALLEQALADGSITQEQVDMMNARKAVEPYFQEAMQTAYQSAVDQAVADGAITQAQADQLLENMDGGFGPHAGPFGGGPAGRPPVGGHGFHPGR